MQNTVCPQTAALQAPIHKLRAELSNNSTTPPALAEKIFRPDSFMFAGSTKLSAGTWAIASTMIQGIQGQKNLT